MLTKKIKTLIIILLLSFAPVKAHSAAGAIGLASIIPGLGQVINGDVLEGAGWFVTTVGLFFSGSPVLGQVGYDIWQYNMFDAYRDAKPSIHRYKDHNVFINYLSVFNPLNIIDPIGAPLVAYGALVGSSRNHFAGVRNPTYIPYFAFVGLGEEGLFRGFLFPALSDVFGTIPGAVVSSAMFSLFHVTNGRGALAPAVLGFRFILGMLFCWQVHLNKYDLRKNIFAHAWYDIFIAPGSPAGVKADEDKFGLKSGLQAGIKIHF